MENFEINEIEKKLEYVFNDKQLLLLAFLHSSYGNFHGKQSNEKLEFLGDSLLNFTVTDYLFKNSTLTEGELSKIKAYLVSSDNLSKIIDSLNVIKYLKCTNFNPTKSKNVKCDLFEAIIGAIYLDSNLPEAQNFIHNQLKLSKNLIDTTLKTSVDYKTKLQEFVQKSGKNEIIYRVIKKEGLSHKPLFTVELLIKGNSICNATMESKKLAENECARLALNKLQNS